MQYPAFAAIDVTVTASSVSIEADFMVSVSAQAVLTGSSPTGTLQFYASNDIANPTNWSAVGSAVSVNATGVWLVPAFDTCYSFIKLVWTKSSGTGTLTANLKSLAYS